MNGIVLMRVSTLASESGWIASILILRINLD